MIKSFPPVVDENTEILVIGTMPSVDSLKEQQFYAHARNQFWSIIFAVFANERTPKNYPDKLNTILAHKVGLWDSLKSCIRPGSLDSNIKEEIPNDFPKLFKKYPNIKVLLFNGQSSFQFYKRAFGAPSKKYHILPSTSPAYASKTFTQKLELWREALTNYDC